MKKLLVILCLAMMVGCTYKKVDESTEVPVKVMTELRNAQSDTVYVVKTEDFHYYYSKDKVLVEKYRVSTADVSIKLFALVWVFFIFIAIGYFIGINNRLWMDT